MEQLSSLEGQQIPSHEIVDFSTYPTIDKEGFVDGNTRMFNFDGWINGSYAFNMAPELTGYFAALKHHNHISTAVETGTFCGGTTVILSYLFDQVYSIEVDKSYYADTVVKFQFNPNVNCLFGSSDEVLATLLPSLENERVLFYLDAHGYGNYPLRNELYNISLTHQDNCIIVIDDIQVPGRKDIPFDSFGPNACSFEYVEDLIETIFSDYTVTYLIPKSVGSRAKLVIAPDQWRE